MSAETDIDQGRAAFRDQRWTDAFRTLRTADQRGGLPAADLERLATAEILTGNRLTGMDTLVRAHEEYLVVGDVIGAARCAAWLAMHLGNAGEPARAGGWLARGQRLAAELTEPDPVQGLMLLPVALGALHGGDPEAAVALFSQVAAFGQKFQDKDLSALALLGSGQAALALGRAEEGLRMFDEAMVAVTAGELSAVPSGIIYCAVIGNCQLTFDFQRALEWTAELDRWCNARPGTVAFSGQCQAHRAELFRLHGAWDEALAAAAVAQQRAHDGDPWALYGGYYQEGEVHRLRGNLDQAEASYKQAARSGREPQPGLALVAMARGNAREAQTMILRAAGQANVAGRRSLLPALVEIGLAAGDVSEARKGADELLSFARECPRPMVRAVAAQADGWVRLHEGDHAGAAQALRQAWQGWLELGVPYEAARCRVLIGLACRGAGDEISARMECEAAQAELLDLGATAAAAWAATLMQAGPGTKTGASTGPNIGPNTGPNAGPLTRREVEVLRLVASGRGNRSIAAELYLSEKTVARHVSNIFMKLGLSNRAAATRYAFEHGLAG
ncbi:LuxR C-terminal-related transcriptional regulator [Pseudarthrobacter sp. J64]|uniref:LuxR C-terminal-related transcriptional regulator n=1 Tax=Pseudarthrobacter sp. J64 TaxID=3116485 RepID=UPI002E8029D7|nr:LuxR C-terminal-related transcriptional regulator [Pseudarthrobacter sp. J64]MEE2568153.1 LuxR C-terminal-related transcriptional regulator [Pseudarthrobacter sp. J64]